MKNTTLILTFLLLTANSCEKIIETNSPLEGGQGSVASAQTESLTHNEAYTIAKCQQLLAQLDPRPEHDPREMDLRFAKALNIPVPLDSMYVYAKGQTGYLFQTFTEEQDVSGIDHSTVFYGSADFGVRGGRDTLGNSFEALYIPGTDFFYVGTLPVDSGYYYKMRTQYAAPADSCLAYFESGDSYHIQGLSNFSFLDTWLQCDQSFVDPADIDSVQIYMNDILVSRDPYGLQLYYQFASSTDDYDGLEPLCQWNQFDLEWNVYYNGHHYRGQYCSVIRYNTHTNAEIGHTVGNCADNFCQQTGTYHLETVY